MPGRVSVNGTDCPRGAPSVPAITRIIVPLGFSPAPVTAGKPPAVAGAPVVSPADPESEPRLTLPVIVAGIVST